jgi:hypothetical protein
MPNYFILWMTPYAKNVTACVCVYSVSLIKRLRAFNIFCEAILCWLTCFHHSPLRLKYSLTFRSSGTRFSAPLNFTFSVISSERRRCRVPHGASAVPSHQPLLSWRILCYARSSLLCTTTRLVRYCQGTTYRLVRHV